MKTRCLDSNYPSFKRYGARGITMYPPWIDDYVAFRNYIIKHLGPRPGPEYSIDRRDNDGNYEPYNLRWATPSEQALNSRQATELTKALNALVWDETL
jgi:hypothetical protein